MSPSEGSGARNRNLAVVIAGFGAMLNLYAPQAILPLLATEFAITPARAAMTVTATTLAVGLVAPFAGAMSDLKGRKRVIQWALVAIAVPTLASVLAVGFDMLVLLRFAQGLFMPAVFAAALAYIAEEVAPGERGRITALYVTANVTGGFVGRMFGSIASEWGDWRLAFLALGAVNLASAIGVGRLMPASRNFVPAATLRQSLSGMFAHLRNPRLLSCFVIGFGILFAQVAVFTYLPFRLVAPPYEFGPAALGAIFVPYLIGAAVTPFSGRAIDRFGQRRALAGATLFAAFGIGLTLSAQLWLMISGLVVLCLAMFLSQSATTSYVGLSAGAGRSSAAGLYLAFYYAGGGAGAVLAGFAYSAGGWAASAWLAIGVEIAVGLLALIAWGGKSTSPR